MTTINNGDALCVRCARVWISSDLMSTNWNNRTWPIRSLSKDSRCKLCRTLYWMFVRTPGHRNFWNGTAKGTTMMIQPNNSGHEYLGLSLDFLDEDHWNLDCSYRLHPVRPTTAGRYVHNLSFNPRWVSRCLKDCDTSHNCRGDVRRYDSKADFHVIDVENRCVVQAPAACQYIALSYVWGKIQQVRLTKQNAASLKKKGSLNPERVPQTIEDALTICRSLSVRYLWVDRLCIMQDSPCHSNSQVAHMHQIYSGAYLTIVAATSLDSASGIFAPQPQLKMQHAARIDSLLYVAAPINLEPLESNLYSSKWNTRAWTMQECVLSRRCLIFTEHDFFLYCGKGAHVPSLKNCLLPPRNTYTSSLLDHQLPFINGNGMVHRRYARLASLYACRDLSYPKDILRAFEGIAKILTPFLGGFYCGLPIGALRWSLCWMQCGTIEPRPGFPSWSWAGWYHFSSDVITAPSFAKNVISFPDFNPNDFWPPCSIYHWSSPTKMEQWPSLLVKQESQRPKFYSEYLESVTKCTCETLRWIWDLPESDGGGPSEGIHNRLLATSAPAFQELPGVDFKHVLTFCSCIASFAGQPTRPLARRFSLSAPDFFQPVLPVRDPQPTTADDATHYRSIAQNYIFLGLWNHGSGFSAVVLPVIIDLLVPRKDEIAEQVVVRRVGNPRRMKAGVWFNNARNCIVHLL